MRDVLLFQEHFQAGKSKLHIDEIIKGSCTLFDVDAEQAMPCSVAILLLGCVSLHPHLDAVARQHVLDTSLQQLIVQQREDTKHIHESGAICFSILLGGTV